MESEKEPNEIEGWKKIKNFDNKNNKSSTNK